MFHAGLRGILSPIDASDDVRMTAANHPEGGAVSDDSERPDSPIAQLPHCPWDHLTTTSFPVSDTYGSI
jgi:hypothetical protein